MKFPKLFLYIFLGIAGLISLGLLIFILTFDANKYKQEITTLVKDATGRELTIAGDIDLSLFPWIGLEVGKVSLSNAEGFGDQPFARIDQLDIKVAVWPLLTQQALSVDKVRLNGLLLSLARDAQGRSNWDDLTGPAEAVEEAKPAEAPEEKPSTPPALAFKINGIELKQATISWEDAQSGTSSKLEDFNLETGSVAMGEPIDIRFSTHISNSKPQLDAAVELVTTVTFDLEQQKFQVSPLQLDINANSNELATRQINATLKSSVDGNLQAQLFQLPSIELVVRAKGEELPGKEIELKLSAAAEANLEQQTAHLKNLQINTMGLNLSGNVQAKNILEQALATGTIKLAQFNPKSLLQQLAVELPPMADANALQTAALDLQFSATPERAEVKDLNIQMDDTVLSGWVKVEDFAQPKLQYQLHANSIDVDRYLPPPPAEPATPTQAPVATDETQEIPLPVDMLKTLDIKGGLKADAIKVMDIQLSKFSMNTKAQGGLIEITPLSMDVYDGNVILDSRLDVRKAEPQYGVNVKAAGIQAAHTMNPLLKGILGDDRLTVLGLAELTASANTQGKSVLALKKGLDGKFSVNADKFVLNGVDLSAFAREYVVEYLKEKKLDRAEQWRGEYKPETKTVFDIMKASGVIEKGVISNKDLLLESKPLKVSGEGQVSLAESTIDYRTVLDARPERTKTFGEKLLDIPLPVAIKGSFSALDIGVDSKSWGKEATALVKEGLKADLQPQLDEQKEKLEAEKAKLKAEQEQKLAEEKEKARQQAEEEKAKVEEKLKEKEDELKDKLKGLFN